MFMATFAGVAFIAASRYHLFSVKVSFDCSILHRGVGGTMHVSLSAPLAYSCFVVHVQCYVSCTVL